MSKIEQLRELVNERIAVADQEIFELFEETITEYEEEASDLKEENKRQRKMLDNILNPQVHLHREEIKEEDSPKQQDWSPGLDQEDPEDEEPLEGLEDDEVTDEDTD